MLKLSLNYGQTKTQTIFLTRAKCLNQKQYGLYVYFNYVSKAIYNFNGKLKPKGLNNNNSHCHHFTPTCNAGISWIGHNDLRSYFHHCFPHLACAFQFCLSFYGWLPLLIPTTCKVYWRHSFSMVLALERLPGLWLAQEVLSIPFYHGTSIDEVALYPIGLKKPYYFVKCSFA